MWSVVTQIWSVLTRLDIYLQTSFTSMKWLAPVFCRKMPFSVVVRNWKRMSPEVAASKVGSSMVASFLRNVMMLSNSAVRNNHRWKIMWRQLNKTVVGCVLDHKINALEMWCYRRMLRISWTSHTTHIDVLQKIGIFKGNNYVKQPEKQKVVVCGPHNEKHIETLWYSAENNRSKTGRQTRKRETKTNMGRRSQRLDWLETIRPDREQLKGETYMGHLHPTSVDATLNE